LSLPDDQAAHPEAPGETWALVLDLEDAAGDRRSMVFTLSRIALTAEPHDPDTPWTPHTAWAAQAALTGDTPLSQERFSRGAGAAGFDRAARSVWLDDWSLSHDSATGGLTLRARLGDVPIRLTLDPLKPAIATDAEIAARTRGFTMPRLAVSGQIGTGDETREVSGLAWLDRVWGEVPFPGGPLVYDRVVLHLDDGRDLTILRTRRRDGRGSQTLDGMMIEPDGTARRLDDNQLRLEFPETPSVRLHIAGAGFDLTAAPLVGSGPRDFAAPVWHGALRVEGTIDGTAIAGFGTVLLGEGGQE
jgi:predicted secreted hydrolase